jgi:hypothetical protein
MWGRVLVEGGSSSHERSHDTSWVPKQCDVIGCKSKAYFKNEGSWKAHQVNKHGSFTPLHCPVQDCKDALNKKLFSSRDSFKQHLGRHGIKGKDVTDCLPKRIGESEWISMGCSFPGCKRGGKYNTRRDYRQHFYDWHKLRKGSTAQYMPF